MSIVAYQFEVASSLTNGGIQEQEMLKMRSNSFFLNLGPILSNVTIVFHCIKQIQKTPILTKIGEISKALNNKI